LDGNNKPHRKVGQKKLRTWIETILGILLKRQPKGEGGALSRCTRDDKRKSDPYEKGIGCNRGIFGGGTLLQEVGNRKKDINSCLGKTMEEIVRNGR